MPAKIDLTPKSPRICLRCNKEFPSTGPSNRICDKCAAVNRKQGSPTFEGTGCRIAPKTPIDD